MKTVAIYFYVKIFKANKKFYMLRTAYFVFPFPVTDNKKDSQFLGSLKLQVGGGARIRTADTAGMNRML